MYSEKPKNYWGPALVVLAVLIFGGMVLIPGLIDKIQIPGAGAAQNERSSENPSQANETNPTPDLGQGPVVEVMLLTSDTKAEWLHKVTDPFNLAGHTTESSARIYVKVVGHGSPQASQQRVIDGLQQPILWSPGDISWIEAANQIRLDRGQRPLVTEDCPRLVSAATGFAMWRPMAEALGWPDEPIGWEKIVDLASDPQGWARHGHPEWGQFTFGHAHPAHSTTGFSVLAALAYDTLDMQAGLTPELVHSPEVTEAFKRLERNTYHYGTSTRGILGLMARRGPSYLHAASASETAMLKNNEVFSDTLRFPFVFIFPAEGTFWSDNPACLVEAEWVTDEQREAALIYRDYLLEPEQQDMAVTIGLRPSDPNIPLHDPISLSYGTDPRVSPNTVPPLESVSGETKDAIIELFEQTKKPATILILLDTSGSMKGPKMEQAIKGTVTFLDRLEPDDRVMITTFADDRLDLQPSGRAGNVIEELKQTLGIIYAKGNTTLYDTVCEAVSTMGTIRAEDEQADQKRLYGIVLLSDGEDTDSEIRQSQMFNCLPSGEDIKGVKIFTIAYGNDAEEDLLLRIANRTNGKSFQGDPETLDEVYLAISSEQ